LRVASLLGELARMSRPFAIPIRFVSHCGTIIES
jgi:hypothetical protein